MSAVSRAGRTSTFPNTRHGQLYTLFVAQTPLSCVLHFFLPPRALPSTPSSSYLLNTLCRPHSRDRVPHLSDTWAAKLSQGAVFSRHSSGSLPILPFQDSSSSLWKRFVGVPGTSCKQLKTAPVYTLTITPPPQTVSSLFLSDCPSCFTRAPFQSL